jgi:CRP-like cAMP-binding protein
MPTYTTLEPVLTSICTHYSPLSEDAKRDLATCSTLETLPKNHVLVKEGYSCDSLFYLLSGSARAYYLKDGRQVTDWFAFEHDFICSINSYFLQLPSLHTIELGEATTLLRISKNSIERLCNAHHDMERLARLVVTKTMLQLQHRIVSTQFETAQQKYENLLLLRPDISLRVPLGQIASYLGITLETLSRIRNPKNRI